MHLEFACSTKVSGVGCTDGGPVNRRVGTVPPRAVVAYEVKNFPPRTVRHPCLFRHLIDVRTAHHRLRIYTPCQYRAQAAYKHPPNVFQLAWSCWNLILSLTFAHIPLLSHHCLQYRRNANTVESQRRAWRRAWRVENAIVTRARYPSKYDGLICMRCIADQDWKRRSLRTA